LQKDDLDNIGYKFMPFVLETTGVTPKKMTPSSTTLVRRSQLTTGIPFIEKVTCLWELLSTTLEKVNAFAIKKRHYEILPHDADEAP